MFAVGERARRGDCHKGAWCMAVGYQWVSFAPPSLSAACLKLLPPAVWRERERVPKRECVVQGVVASRGSLGPPRSLTAACLKLLSSEVWRTKRSSTHSTCHLDQSIFDLYGSSARGARACRGREVLVKPG